MSTGSHSTDRVAPRRSCAHQMGQTSCVASCRALGEMVEAWESRGRQKETSSVREPARMTSAVRRPPRWAISRPRTSIRIRRAARSRRPRSRRRASARQCRAGSAPPGQRGSRRQSVAARSARATAPRRGRRRHSCGRRGRRRRRVLGVTVHVQPDDRRGRSGLVGQALERLGDHLGDRDADNDRPQHLPSSASGGGHDPAAEGEPTTARGTGRNSGLVTASTVPRGGGGSLIHETKLVCASAAPGCSANHHVAAITSAANVASTRDLAGGGTVLTWWAPLTFIVASSRFCTMSAQPTDVPRRPLHELPAIPTGRMWP